MSITIVTTFVFTVIIISTVINMVIVTNLLILIDIKPEESHQLPPSSLFLLGTQVFHASEPDDHHYFFAQSSVWMKVFMLTTFSIPTN